MTRSYVGRAERHRAHAQVLEAHLREQLGDDALPGVCLIMCMLLCVSCLFTPYARLPETGRACLSQNMGGTLHGALLLQTHVSCRVRCNHMSCNTCRVRCKDMSPLPKRQRLGSRA